jgi:hypothetical protein
LGELFVRLQLQSDGAEDLLVSHAQGQIDPAAILQAEHLVAHDFPPAALLPDRSRMHRRQQELLSADGVHFVPNHLRDLVVYPQPERQKRVVARVQLTNESATYQQLMACGLSVAGGVSKCGNERA